MIDKNEDTDKLSDEISNKINQMKNKYGLDNPNFINNDNLNNILTELVSLKYLKNYDAVPGLIMNLKIKYKEFFKEKINNINILDRYITNEYGEIIPDIEIINKIINNLPNINNILEINPDTGLIKYLLSSMNINLISINTYNNIKDTWTKIENISSLHDTFNKYKSKILIIYVRADLIYILSNNINFKNILFIFKYISYIEYNFILKNTICTTIYHDVYNNRIVNIKKYENENLNIDKIDSNKQEILNNYFGYTGLYKLKNDNKLLKEIKKLILPLIDYKNNKNKENNAKKLLNFITNTYKQGIKIFDKNIKLKKDIIDDYILQCIKNYLEKEYIPYLPFLDEIQYLIDFIKNKKVLQIYTTDYGLYAYLLKSYGINIDIIDSKPIIINNDKIIKNYWIDNLEINDNIDLNKYNNIDILLIYKGKYAQYKYYDILKFKGDYIIFIYNNIDYYISDYFNSGGYTLEILNKNFKLISSHNTENNNDIHINKINIYSNK